MILLACLAAWAAGGEEPPPTKVKDPHKLVWSGVVLPLFGANSTDGPGFGVGGEVFARPRRETTGYRVKFSGALWATTRLSYTSDYVQFEFRDETHWIGQVGFRGWRDHVYAGAGGADILVLRPPSLAGVEVGNRVWGPFGFLGASRPVGDHWKLFAQAYYKTYFVRAHPDGLLGTRAPYGHGGATYVDLTIGLEYDSTDRWPMPWNGVRAEWSGRVGATFAHAESVGFLAGSNFELIGWKSLGKHLTFGGRVVGDQTAGKRPFFEQEIAGGRRRDEVGSEQTFAGYGRTRTRGDGLLAAMVEVRPYFFKTKHKFLDFAFYGSLFAEVGWLNTRDELGPILPTVGVAPQVLFQGAIQMRPYVAWGWRAEDPTGERRPVPQYGISFLDPL